jgi:ribosomal protein S11
MPRSSARAAIRKMFRRAVIKPPRSKRSHSRDLPFFVDLQPLEISTATFPAGTPQGTLFALISNATPGSTVVADDPRVQVDSSGTKLQVGQSPASPGTFDITLTETQGDLTLDTVITITVSGALADTTAPTILNSNAATVAENATLSFALTANETVTWTLVGGADQARFEISGSTLRWASNGTKNFEAPNDANTDNAYIVTVRATDTAGNATDQTITVTVSDIDELAPTITSATTGNNVENTALAFALTADETVTWSLTGGTDLARFELNGSTLRWAGNGTKNFEAPNDSNTNNTYVVQVTATDTAGNATNQTVTITVTDADEVAPTITSSATPSVVENQTFSLTLTANETVTWSKVGGDDATQFTLVGSTLSMTAKDFETMGDFNTDNVYEVTVRATDTAGNTTDQNISVTVTDADEIAPTITSSASPTVAESSPFSMSADRQRDGDLEQAGRCRCGPLHARRLDPVADRQGLRGPGRRGRQQHLCRPGPRHRHGWQHHGPDHHPDRDGR